MTDNTTPAPASSMLRLSNHRKQEQRVTLKLGKLRALAALTEQMGALVAKPAPGLAAEDRERYEERCAGYQRLLDHRKQEQRPLQRELDEARHHRRDLSRHVRRTTSPSSRTQRRSLPRSPKRKCQRPGCRREQTPQTT